MLLMFPIDKGGECDECPISFLLFFQKNSTFSLFVSHETAIFGVTSSFHSLTFIFGCTCRSVQSHQQHNWFDNRANIICLDTQLNYRLKMFAINFGKFVGSLAVNDCYTCFKREKYQNNYAFQLLYFITPSSGCDAILHGRKSQI